MTTHHPKRTLSTQHRSGKETDPRALLAAMHADLVQVAMLAQAASEALVTLPFPVTDPRSLRRLDALVSVAADVASAALRDADSGIAELEEGWGWP